MLPALWNRVISKMASAMALGKLFKDGQGNVSAAPEELFEHAQLRTVRLAQHPAKDVQECRHCAHAPQLLALVAD